MDCCHSAGINRHEGPEGISRCVPNPPALTAEANPLHDRVMPGRLADQASGLRGTRALQIPSRFGRTNDHSHVLLAACGKGQSAYELKDGSHGIFTSALLTTTKFSERLKQDTERGICRMLSKKNSVVSRVSHARGLLRVWCDVQRDPFCFFAFSSRKTTQSSDP